jgi:CRISPR-associated protein Csm5
MKTYRLKCEILSPLHIGTGHELTPLDYVIKEGTLHKISFEKYVLAMDDAERGRFERLIEEGNLARLRQHVSERMKRGDAVYSVEVAAPVQALYALKVGDVQNQLIVAPFVRTGEAAVPFLPGSSVKGAIRTAVISDLAKTSGLPRPKDSKEEYAFESQVLGYKDGKDDPFRAIKLSNVPLKHDVTIVREVRNLSKKRDGGLQANDIQMICETTHSRVSGKEVTFDTQISIDETLIATRIFSKAFTLEQIVTACREFYRDKMEKEHQKFYKNSSVSQWSQRLLDTPLGGQAFLLRLGRFSGVESVTLDNYRNPRPPGDKGWGSSRNLAEGIYPMGWIMATVVA